jgi:hypothetical protein
MTLAPGAAPLIAVIMSHVEENARVSEATVSLLHEHVRGFLEQRVTFAEAAEVFHRCTGTCAPLERLRDIIHTGDTPLPNGALQPGWFGRRHIRPWTLWEDQRLLAGIYRVGLDSWDIVADFVGNGRTRAQCCQRWCRGLDPAIAKDAWTAENDDRLLTLVALHGSKSWTQIACELGNRCDVQCRYRYGQLAKTANFEARMRAATERASGMCHVKRPRKRPAKTVLPQKTEASSRQTNHTVVQRVRLPPISELDAAIALLSNPDSNRGIIKP